MPSAAPMADAVDQIRALEGVDVAFSAQAPAASCSATCAAPAPPHCTDWSAPWARRRRQVCDLATRDRLHRICLRLVPEASVVRPAARLSPREVDVLAQVAVGCSNAETARRLSLQVETVRSYLKTAMAKLDSHNRCEAVFVAQRAGLLP